MRSWIDRWRGRPLDADEAAALRDERLAQNRRRLVVVGTLMTVVHAAHAWHFHVGAAERAGLGATELRWRDGLVTVHLVTMVFAAAMALLAWRVRAPRVLAVLGPVTAIGYLVHGAVITGIDQLMVANMTAYIGYVFGIALLVALTPLEAALAYALGATALMVALVEYAPEAALRENLPSSVTITLVGLCTSWFGASIRKRELVQRLTIERQARELAALNANLERRVQEQVQEIQAQVRARSLELSHALQRLSRQMETSRGLEPGEVIAGRFVVERAVGEGGMGRVYAGLDKLSSTRVAIKVLQVSSTKQLDSLRRFIREAGATATVTHPAVVRVLAFDVSDDGLLYQVQELVDGHTLTRRLGRPWPAGQAARLGAVLADALAAAHARGVIHRDVKPDNILLTRTAPGLKLVDFGIAKLLDAAAAEGATVEHAVVGTPAYMAPEQVTGGEGITAAADVYAVGAIVYQLITGALPVDADGAHELMMRKLTDDPSLAGLPARYADVLGRCLARAPDGRPTAAELATALLALADADGAPALESVPPPAGAIDSTAVERISR